MEISLFSQEVTNFHDTPTPSCVLKHRHFDLLGVCHNSYGSRMWRVSLWRLSHNVIEISQLGQQRKRCTREEKELRVCGNHPRNKPDDFLCGLGYNIKSLTRISACVVSNLYERGSCNLLVLANILCIVHVLLQTSISLRFRKICKLNVVGNHSWKPIFLQSLTMVNIALVVAGCFRAQEVTSNIKNCSTPYRLLRKMTLTDCLEAICGGESFEFARPILLRITISLSFLSVPSFASTTEKSSVFEQQSQFASNARQF